MSVLKTCAYLELLPFKTSRADVAQVVLKVSTYRMRIHIESCIEFDLIEPSVMTLALSRNR